MGIVLVIDSVKVVVVDRVVVSYLLDQSRHRFADSLGYFSGFEVPENAIFQVWIHAQKSQFTGPSLGTWMVMSFLVLGGIGGLRDKASAFMWTLPGRITRSML